jgi:hypothetical protein
MSTLKSNTVTASSSNTDLNLEGTGTGTVNLPTGFKVNNTTNSFLSSASGVTVAQGGTGASTFAANGVLFGNGTSAIGATAVGTSAQVLTSNGSGVAPTFQDAAGGGFTLGTEQSTASGTGVTFTGIPAGVTCIIISWEVVSQTSADSLYISIGDAGGLETSGYAASAGYYRSASNVVVSGAVAAFNVLINNASINCSGQMTLTLKDAANYTWVSTHVAITGGGVSGILSGTGTKSLSGELTQLKFANAAGNFDGGSVNIMYQ